MVVIEHRNAVNDLSPCFVPRLVIAPVPCSDFREPKTLLTTALVPVVAFAAHTVLDTVGFGPSLRGPAGVLNTSIRRGGGSSPISGDGATAPCAVCHRHGGVVRQPWLHRPTHYHAGTQIKYHRQVEPAFPYSGIGDI